MDIACLRERYLYLLRECLVDGIYKEDQVTLKGTSLPPDKVGEGFYFPKKAHTMLGRKKLDNIKHCMEYCLNNNIPLDDFARRSRSYHAKEATIDFRSKRNITDPLIRMDDESAYWQKKERKI